MPAYKLCGTGTNTPYEVLQQYYNTSRYSQQLGWFSDKITLIIREF